MKKIILNAIAAVLMVLGLGAVSTVSPVMAKATFICPDGTPVSDADDYNSACADHGIVTDGATNKDLLITGNTIVSLVIGLVGFVAVVMIVIGGISFATSQGDTAKTTKAKNTVLYGVIGLVVALLAYAIVSFVLTGINK